MTTGSARPASIGAGIEGAALQDAVQHPVVAEVLVFDPGRIP